MKIIKSITLVISIIVCLLWLYDTDTNWEPIFVIVTLLFQAIVDFFSRKESEKELESYKRQLIDNQTGGETFSYIMLYNFSISNNWARDFVVVKKGKNSLYNLSYRIVDYTKTGNNTVVPETKIGEVNSPAIFSNPKWTLKEHNHYGIFFHGRNGSWTQELILNKSEEHNCWLAATRVRNRKGVVIHNHVDNSFETSFGAINWKNKI